MDFLSHFHRFRPLLNCVSYKNGALSQIHLNNARYFAKDPPPEPIPLSKRTRPLYLKRYHEPEYLEKLKPSIPFYELYNIQVKGYDHAIVEQYIKLIQRLCKDVGVKLESFWPVPARLIRLETYAHESWFVENTEEVKIHQRTVQVKHLTTTQLSILVDVINQAKPPGVIVSFLQHTQGQEDDKYIVDRKLLEAEAQLKELRKPISLLGNT